MEYEDRYVDYKVLYYCPEENIFTDEDGQIIFDIFELVPPYLIEQFKEDKESIIYEKSRTQVVELFYTDGNEESDAMDRECNRLIHEYDCGETNH